MDTETLESQSVKPLEWQKDYLMQHFDFERVQRSMEILNWEWNMNRGQAVPSFEELYAVADKELQNLVDDEDVLYGYCGGLLGRKDNGVLSLAFCIGFTDATEEEE